MIASELAEYLNIDREKIRKQFQRKPTATPARRLLEVSSSVPPNERLLLACLLASPDARMALRHYRANRDLPGVLELRSVFDAILQFDETSAPFSLDVTLESLDSRLQRIVTEIGFADMGVSEEGAAGQALHCLTALEDKALSARRDTLRQQIRELEQTGKFPEALKLADELNRIGRPALGA